MYPILDIKIPQDKRADINRKILHIVDNNIDHPQINKNVIFNSYSGDGGLHGLNFNDYDSYHSFSEAKKEIELGAFHTPLKLSKFLSILLRVKDTDFICDMTSGIGNLINWMPNYRNVYLNEINMKSFKVMKYLFPECNLSNDDMRNFQPDVKMDAVIGNPPFNIRMQYNKNTYNSQLVFMLKASEVMSIGGLCIIIVPESFLVDDFANKGEIKLINERFNFIESFLLPKSTFKETGANISCKIMIFQRKSEHIQDREYTASHLPIVLESIDHQVATLYYKQYIKPLYEQKETLKGKLLLEAIQQGNEKNNDFEYKVKKLLFDIKRTKATTKHYDRAVAYLLKFKTQEKPYDMKYEEWIKIRVTENKVLSYLKKVLKEQHKAPEKHITRLVRTRYGLKMKSYSTKERKLLKAYTGVKEMSWNDMVLSGEYPFNDKKYEKLFEKKKREYTRQSQSFKDMNEKEYIKQWLNDLTITDHTNEREIKLNEIQKYDTNLMLQKKYGYLQYGTGSGKTLCGISQMLYRFQHNKIKNAFVVAPAIAITNNWVDCLDSYKIPFIEIRKLSDIKNIKSGQIVLITFNMLTKYKKHIKEFIKKQNNKVMLCCDEADGIMNISSRRSLVTIDCFKHVKYKLLMSANMVRNSIPEAFAGFHLLYNSSINLLNKAEKIYVENVKTKEIEEKVNEKYYMYPFPPHKKGHTLFKRTFSPSRKTVFGANRNTQDIVNSQLLKELIDKTIITRTFEEVSGKDIYKIIQHTCEFNSEEKDLYKTIIEEFYRLSNVFRKTGNHKKDALLQIIAQINALLRSCTIPNSFKEYKSNKMPSKAIKALEILDGWKNELVAIGCVNIKTVETYANYIRNHFPDREVFVITGQSTTLKQRKVIIEKLRKSKNGILIATQSSLSMSMNIDFVNKILNIQCPYNYSSVWQFTARFIRYTSKEQKEVHFLTMNNSLESNLLQLIVNKESLVSYMRNEDLNHEELYEQFGINYDLLSNLLTREIDSTNGSSYIHWGQQTVS